MKTCRGEYCAAPNCSNNRGRCKHLSFFRFPRESVRCKRWVSNCGRADLASVTSHVLNNRYSLCADHFEESMFMNINDRNRLIHNAVPTLFDDVEDLCAHKYKNSQASEELKPVFESPVEVEIDETIANVNRDHMYSMATATTDGCNANSTVTSTAMTCTGTGDQCGAGTVRRYHRDNLCSNQRSAWQQTDPPCRRDKVTSTSRVLKTVEELRLRKLIRRQCKQISRMQKQMDNLQDRLTKATKSYKVTDLIEGSKHYLNGLAHSFFNAQLLLSSKKAQGKRWPEDVKKFVVSIYRTSPKAYRLLAKEFILPSKKSIRKVALAEGDSVENAINSVVESSFKEEMNLEMLNGESFQLELENAVEEETGVDDKVHIMEEKSEMIESVESGHNFQPMDEIIKFTENILQPNEAVTTLTMESASDSVGHVEITETGLVLDTDSGIPVVAQHIQGENGNVSVIYPSVQELQILPMEIFHYMVQQS